MSLPAPLLDPYGDLFKLLELPGDPERLRELRRKLVWAYAWAVPTREAVDAIAAYSPLIEIGAGTGYWAWLLRQAGADVLAFDRNTEAPPHWSPVASGGPETLARYPERTLLLCWPPMGEGLATQCLERYTGERVISIGERGEGARTGDEAFQRLLDECYIEERVVQLPCWPGYSDCLTIYRRRAR